MRTNKKLGYKFIAQVEGLSFTMSSARIAAALGSTEYKVKKALELIKNEAATAGMDDDVKKYYQQGARSANLGRPIESCIYGYGNIKAFCAWMGGYNDHKTTRKQS